MTCEYLLLEKHEIKQPTFFLIISFRTVIFQCFNFPNTRNFCLGPSLSSATIPPCTPVWVLIRTSPWLETRTGLSRCGTLGLETRPSWPTRGLTSMSPTFTRWMIITSWPLVGREPSRALTCEPSDLTSNLRFTSLSWTVSLVSGLGPRLRWEVELGLSTCSGNNFELASPWWWF